MAFCFCSIIVLDNFSGRKGFCSKVWKFDLFGQYNTLEKASAFKELEQLDKNQIAEVKKIQNIHCIQRLVMRLKPIDEPIREACI